MAKPNKTALQLPKSINGLNFPMEMIVQHKTKYSEHTMHKIKNLEGLDLVKIYDQNRVQLIINNKLEKFLNLF